MVNTDRNELPSTECCFDIENFSYYELHRSEKLKDARRNSAGIIVYIRKNTID